jgi:hypothetical protein
MKDWIDAKQNPPELSEMVLAYDPTAVVKYIVCWYLPIKITEFAAAFTVGSGGPYLWNVTHYHHLTPPNNKPQIK